MVKLHALVIFDSVRLESIETKIYTPGSKGLFGTGRFVREFVNFGSKELLSKINVTDPEFVITFGPNEEFTIYVTIDQSCSVGLALMMSETPELDRLPHLVSKKIIREYLAKKIIPRSPAEIIKYFKHKEVRAQLDETKQVLKRTVSKVLERGERIEDLVAQTDLLSETSKIFFQRSRDLNSCCWGKIKRPRWW